MKLNVCGWIAVSLTFAGCVSRGTKMMPNDQEKKVIETSYRRDQEPAWMRDARMSWDDADQHMIRATYTISARQRISGCIDLAKAEVKEALISEIANEIKGEIVRASQGLDEAEDEGLSKTMIEKFQGDTRGLRFVETAFERSIVNDTEHVECFVLGRIKNSDYAQIKNRILANTVRTEPRIRKILEDRQVRMLSSETDKPEIAKTSAP